MGSASARSEQTLVFALLCRYSHVHGVVFVAKQEINVSACAAFLVYFKTFKYLGLVPKMDQVGSPACGSSHARLWLWLSAQSKAKHSNATQSGAERPTRVSLRTLCSCFALSGMQ
jgi:hypothetical protein